MKISEVLIKARDILQEKGWYQGNWHAPDGRVCLETAIAEAIGEQIPSQVNFHPVGRTLINYLELEKMSSAVCPCGCGITMFGGASLASWNDRAERTFTEVIEALEVCALIEAEKEEREPVKVEITAIPSGMFIEVGQQKPVSFPKVTLTATGELPKSIEWTFPVYQQMYAPAKELVSV